MGTSITATTKEKKAEDSLVGMYALQRKDFQSEVLLYMLKQLSLLTGVTIEPGDKI